MADEHEPSHPTDPTGAAAIDVRTGPRASATMTAAKGGNRVRRRTNRLMSGMVAVLLWCAGCSSVDEGGPAATTPPSEAPGSVSGTAEAGDSTALLEKIGSIIDSGGSREDWTSVRMLAKSRGLSEDLPLVMQEIAGRYGPNLDSYDFSTKSLTDDGLTVCDSTGMCLLLGVGDGELTVDGGPIAQAVIVEQDGEDPFHTTGFCTQAGVAYLSMLLHLPKGWTKVTDVAGPDGARPYITLDDDGDLILSTHFVLQPGETFPLTVSGPVGETTIEITFSCPN